MTVSFRKTAPTVAIGLILFGATILNFTAYAGQYLGVDEVWTGMIAAQSSLRGLIRQCELDVNGPLSYVIAWLWAPLGGLSNSGLRLPSTLFACVTPFVALASRRHLRLMTRVIWAVLLACWLPEFAFAQLARCYALVLLLATVNTLAFAQMVRRPGLSTALVWSGLSALLILDHYFACVLVACQGVIYLALGRSRALRTWPAALAFLPVVADIALKRAVLSNFSSPGVSWIDRVSWEDLPNVLGFLAGSPFLAAAIGVGVAIGWLMDRFGPRRSEARIDTRLDTGPMSAAAAAALAAGISVTLGFIFPILTARYLSIEVPGVMLGAALLATRFARGWPLLPVWLIAGAASGAMSLAGHTVFVGPPSITAFSFQRAAEALMADHPRRVVFFWDNPVAQGGDLDQLSQVGGFFFKRAHANIAVDAVGWVRRADPNSVLLAKAAEPGTDILWMFDRDVQGTSAIDHPPAISQRDPRWACQDYGAGDIVVLACLRRHDL